MEPKWKLLDSQPITESEAATLLAEHLRRTPNLTSASQKNATQEIRKLFRAVQAQVQANQTNNDDDNNTS